MIIKIRDTAIVIGTPEVGNPFDIAIRNAIEKAFELERKKKRTPKEEEAISTCIETITYNIREKRIAFRKKQADILSRKKRSEQLY